MIRQMERRFALVAISVVSLVLLTLIILVNAISINSNIHRADDTLNKLSGLGLDENAPIKHDDGGPIIQPFSERSIQREENRSFEVVIGEGGSLISSNASYRNLTDDTIAYEIALEILEGSKTTGFADGFRYLVVDEGTTTKVIFLDYSIEKNAEYSFMLNSAGVYFVSVLLTSLLVIILLKPVMKSIKESYAKQKRFITDASHELKTPLTVISTNMEIIEMENGESQWTSSVKSHVKRMNALTNELVTLSRMDEESTQLVLKDVNLSDIVNDVIMGFEPAINAENRTLEVGVEDGIRIQGNHDALERVMSVLMNNALKYSDAHGTISVDLHQKGKKVTLSVKNTVASIEKGSHNEFFERFYRSDASRNSETGGFGIGLAVAQSTIEEHHGKIEAQSSDEKSLEVMITLKSKNYLSDHSSL